LGQTKDYKIGIRCFSAKHAALRRKNKDWLARNQDNVSEWSDMSIRGRLFKQTNTIQTKLYSGLLTSLSVEVIDNAAILFNNFAMHTFSDQINENMLRFALY
jgi:hypothetical protein